MGWGCGIQGCIVGVTMDLIWGEELIPMETVEEWALRRAEWCLTPNSSESPTPCFLTRVSSSDLKSVEKKGKKTNRQDIIIVLSFYRFVFFNLFIIHACCNNCDQPAQY